MTVRKFKDSECPPLSRAACCALGDSTAAIADSAEQVKIDAGAQAAACWKAVIVWKTTRGRIGAD